MINSTLGGLIKDYRLQKGISQLDIAFSLGWKETSRLSRIEQGRTERPSRELIDKIIAAIGLEEEEKNTLLLTGGYLPTQEEIAIIRKETQDVLNRWPYPASVLDFSWRAINQNKHSVHVYNMSSEEEKMIYDLCPRVLDILFSQNLTQNRLTKGNEAKNNWHAFLKTIILNFKYEQRHRTKEKWYIDHIRTLMQNDLFRVLWVETNMKDRLQGVIGKSATKSLICPENNNKVLHFFLFVLPVLKDPRFEVEVLVPQNSETYRYFESTTTK